MTQRKYQITSRRICQIKEAKPNFRPIALFAFQSAGLESLVEGYICDYKMCL